VPRMPIRKVFVPPGLPGAIAWMVGEAVPAAGDDALAAADDAGRVAALAGTCVGGRAGVAWDAVVAVGAAPAPPHAARIVAPAVAAVRARNRRRERGEAPAKDLGDSDDGCICHSSRENLPIHLKPEVS
jgi:hypothetical protein